MISFAYTTLLAVSAIFFTIAAHADSPGALTPLFANNAHSCIPTGVKDLPAFSGNLAANGTCKVSVVVSGKVPDVSAFYFTTYQKKGWSVANRIETPTETRFSAQQKKLIYSLRFIQVSAENTEIEFSY